MNIAFYAPLKPPDHPIPSGDRLIARLLLRALEQAGHSPMLAARFRSFDAGGDSERQRRIQRLGERLAARLERRLDGLGPDRRPHCWLTYHLYHKAPDWIGPAVARSLRIPYVVVEASVAPKQRHGPWRQGYAAAAAAIAQANLVVSINRRDMPCVEATLADPRRLVYLPPFLDLAWLDSEADAGTSRESLAGRLGLDPARPWLITVAMMRSGNKQDSYRLLAEALRANREHRWQLLVVGDGPMRSRVEAAFEGVQPSRAAFLGLRSREEIASLLKACDLFVWPAVAEPLGMAMLEAHAAGLAVVAGNSGGVADIVRPNETGLLTPPGDAAAFAAAVTMLLADGKRRQAMGKRATARVQAMHSLPAAAAALDRWLSALVAEAKA